MGQEKLNKADVRATNAILRGNIRNVLSPVQQLMRLDDRLGKDIGATKERTRLTQLLHSNALVVDNQLTTKGRDAWKKGIITLDGKTTTECDVLDANGDTVIITWYKGLNEYAIE